MKNLKTSPVHPASRHPNVLDKFGMTSAEDFGSHQAIPLDAWDCYIYQHLYTININQMQVLYVYTIYGSYGYRNSSN